jgi:hypothetical protein
MTTITLPLDWRDHNGAHKLMCGPYVAATDRKN